MSLSEDARAEIVRAIFPEQLPTPADLEARFPPRPLGETSMVTRVGPSPTGFMHIGTLYVALLSERFAHQSGGVFFLRLEDTDKKREVEGAADFINEAFEHFGIAFDEGRLRGGSHVGRYGPYTQSERAGIYHSYVRHLVEKDLAYPCFCATGELEALRARQQAEGVRPGYYGHWAKCRHKPAVQTLEALRNGLTYVIRFKSPGDVERRLMFEDLIFGPRMIPENDQDVVILKSDRLPTYHFAHVVDDHLMRTTHVIRGDEWLSSVAVHLQLFAALEWKAPAYVHIAPINKLDGNSRRKLSKRKDPEASVSYFIDAGYPPEAVIEYLLNIANSNFEDWRQANPNADYRDFPASIEKLRGSSGPLFDFPKLDSISRDVVARLPTAELQRRLVEWAKAHDPDFAAMLEKDPAYTLRMLNIEREGPKIRKDIGKWSEVRGDIEFFFDEWFHQEVDEAVSKLGSVQLDDAIQIVEAFTRSYRPTDDPQQWLDNIKAIAKSLGFAEKMGEYKRNPDAYKGTVADVAKVLRVLLTGRTQTPDLYSIMQAMGEDRVFSRLSIALQKEETLQAQSG